MEAAACIWSSPPHPSLVYPFLVSLLSLTLAFASVSATKFEKALSFASWWSDIVGFECPIYYWDYVKICKLNDPNKY